MSIRPTRPTMPASTPPSVVKRINNKHNILNGLLNSDGSVDGEKLMEKLESNSKDSTQKEKFKVGDELQFVRTLRFPSGGYIKKGTVWEIAAMNDTRYTILLVDGEEGVKGIGYNINSSIDTINSYCEKVEAKGNDSEEAKTKGSHYEKAAMQPLEVMQRIMTEEQFKGFLFGNCIKYCMRKNYKGQHDSDEYKARQYAYWLELADMGQTINPTEDKVPDSYRFKVV